MQFNRHFMNRIEKKDVLRLLLALVAVFVIGVLGEFVCNFPALRANGWTRQATRTIALDEVQASGFERVETEKNGLGEITGEPGQTIGENRRQVENTEVLQLSDVSGYLHIPLDGSYVSQRPFVLVTVEGKALSETAQKFFDYVTSPEAADVIAKAGAVAAN